MSEPSIDLRTLGEGPWSEVPLPGVEVVGDAVRWGASHAAQWVAAIDAWSTWMAAAGTRPRTIELRRWQIGHLAESFIRRSPWGLRTGELLEWCAGQAWASETRKSYRAALRSFYSWGRRSGHTRRDPTGELLPVRTTQLPPRPAPDEVLERALAAATDRDRLILALAAYAGLRRAEIAGLRWEDIGPPIRVYGKGGRVRVVPLHPVLRDELGRQANLQLAGGRRTGYRYQNAPPGGRWVFPGKSGGPMTPGAVGQAASRALGPGWTCHTLRHRFATRAYAGTHDLLAVQALLGHAKPETTKRYTELADDSLAAAVRSV